MDVLSLLGVILAFVAILGGNLLEGGALASLFNAPAALIVVGGTLAATILQTSWPVLKHALSQSRRVFVPPFVSLEDGLDKVVNWSVIARKKGLLGLEGLAENEQERFVQKGLLLLVDGADEAKLVGQMEAEIEAMKVRHGDMQGCVKAWIDLAPAMGMIGTLVGLVIMLGNMSDPASIGPAMAVALLTTMYGAIIANVLFMPMLTKLENYSSYEVVYRQTVILGLRGIARGESPRNMQDQMVSLLAPKAQEKFEAAA